MGVGKAGNIRPLFSKGMGDGVQDKKWWPEEVHAVLEEAFGQGSVKAMPTSFLPSLRGRAKPVLLVLDGAEAFRQAAVRWASGGAEAGFPLMTCDTDMEPGVLRLSFSADAGQRGAQLAEVCRFYGAYMQSVQDVQLQQEEDAERAIMGMRLRPTESHAAALLQERLQRNMAKANMR